MRTISVSNINNLYAKLYVKLNRKHNRSNKLQIIAFNISVLEAYLQKDLRFNRQQKILNQDFWTRRMNSFKIALCNISYSTMF